MSGFLWFVGQLATSLSVNEFFDIIVQRAKSDIATIRVMVSEGLNRDSILSMVNKDDTMITLSSIFLSVGYIPPTEGRGSD